MGGGLFADMFKDVTYRIREYIHGHEEEFLGIVESPEFTAHFRIMGTSLKNVPKGYPSDCPAAEYLKYKSWPWKITVAIEDNCIQITELRCPTA